MVVMVAELQDKINCDLSMRDHVIGGWNAESVDLPIPSISTLVSLLPDHGYLWIDNCRWYVTSVALATTMHSHLHAQFACGHLRLGKPPNYQALSMTPPFEETAHFHCQNAPQPPTPLSAKLCKSSMTASLPSTRPNQIKRRPLLSAVSYLQAQSDTKTDASCLIESFDLIRLNKKCMMQLHALCCKGYWTDSTRLCSHMG
jgi:hypothetical protein